MELRQLRHFVAVATEGNISRAAKKIFLTQPALSRQIKALEHEIGQCLLERRAQSIRLTPAGQLLLQEARQLLEHADQVLERARASHRVARLRVGYAPSLAAAFLPAAVERFTQAHPEARVDLLDLSTAEMLAGLEAERIDIALTVEPKSGPRGLTWTPLIRSPWKLAVGRTHPLVRRRRIGPRDVAEQPLLVYNERDYPEYWENVASWLRAHKLRPRIGGEYDGSQSLLAAVEAGLGVAVVASRSTRLLPGRARYLNIISAPPPLCIAAACPTQRLAEPALARLLAELKTAGAALG